jgi:hypothetical protein
MKMGLTKIEVFFRPVLISFVSTVHTRKRGVNSFFAWMDTYNANNNTIRIAGTRTHSKPRRSVSEMFTETLVHRPTPSTTHTHGVSDVVVILQCCTGIFLVVGIMDFPCLALKKKKKKQKPNHNPAPCEQGEQTRVQSVPRVLRTFMTLKISHELYEVYAWTWYFVHHSSVDTAIILYRKKDKLLFFFSRPKHSVR